MRIRRVLALACTLVLATPSLASDDTIKIGVLTDHSGMNKDLGGPGSVIAAQLAIEDFGGTVGGRRISVITADHGNKADTGASIARRWYDVEGVDLIADVPVSSVALAVQDIAKEKDRLVIFSGAGSSDINGKFCSPRGFQFAFDSVALSNGVGTAVVKSGGDSWFIITADYAFGHALERDLKRSVEAAGGKVIGTVRHPYQSSDFASFLLQAQGSGAKVIGFANAAGDLINIIKQSHEFGISGSQQSLAALLIFISDVHSLGLEQAKGLQLLAGFYWDMDDASRAWSKRFREKSGGVAPTVIHAGVYSGVMHYLKAVEKSGTKQAGPVSDKMREMPVEDFYTKGAKIFPNGWVQRDFHLFKVKSPAESKGPWDYYSFIRSIPGSEVKPVEAMSECPLMKRS